MIPLVLVVFNCEIAIPPSVAIVVVYSRSEVYSSLENNELFRLD